MSTVQQTLAGYARALDHRDPAALAGLLTDDATWTFTTAGAPGPGPVTGRPAILDFVRAATAAHTARRRHHLTTLTAAEAPDGTAEAHAYLILTSAANGAAHILTTGAYTFTLRRTGTTWRIATLSLDMDA